MKQRGTGGVMANQFYVGPAMLSKVQQQKNGGVGEVGNLFLLLLFFPVTTKQNYTTATTKSSPR
jgi:hypothetical protein